MGTCRKNQNADLTQVLMELEENGASELKITEDPDYGIHDLSKRKKTKG